MPSSLVYTDSIWRKIFYALSAILVCILLIWGGLYIADIIIQNTITEQRDSIAQIENKLSVLGETQTFNKLELARYIQANHVSIPRSDRIELIVGVLQKLQSITYQGNDSIRLYDFSVSLDAMTIKGEVSNIALLYYSSPSIGYTSLLELFEELPFVKNITIREYRSIGGVISFTLQASLHLLDTAHE